MFRRTSLKCDRFMRPMAFVSLLTVLCVLLCACGTAVPTGSLSSGGDTPPVMDATTVRETTSSTTDATTASVTEKTTTGETPTIPPTTSPTTKTPTTATTASAEPSLPVIMAEKPDKYNADVGTVFVEGKNKAYITDYLTREMEKHKGEKVLYRVLVKGYIGGMDSSGYQPSAEKAKELQPLYDAAVKAQQACDEAEKLYQSTPAGGPRQERYADYKKKSDTVSACWKSYYELRDADEAVYLDGVLQARQATLEKHSVSVAKVSPTSGYTAPPNSMKGFQRIALITEEGIRALSVDSNYIFSLAPPPRREGYSSIIADELTNRLHTMKNTDKAKVFVVYRDKTHGAKAMTKADILALADSDKAEIIYDHNYAGSWTIGIK